MTSKKTFTWEITTTGKGHPEEAPWDEYHVLASNFKEAVEFVEKRLPKDQEIASVSVGVQIRTVW